MSKKYKTRHPAVDASRFDFISRILGSEFMKGFSDRQNGFQLFSAPLNFEHLFFCKEICSNSMSKSAKHFIRQLTFRVVISFREFWGVSS